MCHATTRVWSHFRIECLSDVSRSDSGRHFRIECLSDAGLARCATHRLVCAVIHVSSVFSTWPASWIRPWGRRVFTAKDVTIGLRTRTTKRREPEADFGLSYLRSSPSVRVNANDAEGAVIADACGVEFDGAGRWHFRSHEIRDACADEAQRTDAHRDVRD